MSCRQAKGEINEIVFVNGSSSVYSRSKNYFNGLRKLGIKVSWVEIEPTNKWRQLYELKRKFRGKAVNFIITSPNHLLVIYARMVGLNNLYLDAGWPLYDGVVLSRREFGKYRLKPLITFCIDYFSFHLARRVFVETLEQKENCTKKFVLLRKRLVVLETGFDEERDKIPNELGLDIGSSFRILFRGGSQVEAGIPILLKAARNLEVRDDIVFIIASQNLLPTPNLPANVIIIKDFLTDSALAGLYHSVDLVLGQLSSHPRLMRTLPHKFFEAAYYKKCYLTSNIGVAARYVEKKVISGFDHGDSDSLTNEILTLMGSQSLRQEYALRFGQIYSDSFSQERLSKHLLDSL